MPRPPSKSGLDDATQRELCWWMAQGCGPEDAAKRAGLPNANRLYHFAKTQEFSVVLRQSLSKHLADDLAPKAVKILNEIMHDTNVASRVRVDAAKAVLDRSGFSASATPSVAGQKALNELSLDDLHRLVATLEEERANEAKPVAAGSAIVVRSEECEDVDPME